MNSTPVPVGMVTIFYGWILLGMLSPLVPGTANEGGSSFHPEDHTIDVLEVYGNINQSSIGLAIQSARAWLQTGTTVVVYFQAGTFNISTTNVTFSIDDIKPADDAWLVFKGAGMGDTVLRFDGLYDVISGRNVVRVRFEHLTFARQHLTTSQGIVVHASEEEIILDIQDGYPGIASIMGDPKRLPPGAGRFVRLYHVGVDGESCELTTGPDNGTIWPPTANRQVVWHNATRALGVRPASNRWILSNLKWPSGQPRYQPGDILGVKSKHNGQAFFVDGGASFAFDHVQWTEHSRGVIRGGLSNISVTHCRVDKSPLAPQSTPRKRVLGQCMSTSGGGPQLGQPNDPITYNVVVKNHTSAGTGDDSIALFHVGNASITDCHIEDSFARGILLYHSKDVQLARNTLVRCPLYNDSAVQDLTLSTANVPSP
eukprot:m.402602 g.402602  ORF g.402602 m.402602 type:complete len:428 (-) comp21182_c0_seq3:224-1507(-)